MMRFGLSEEQDELRGLVRGILDDKCDPAVVRAAWDRDNDPAVVTLWETFAELGLLTALAKPERGGLGLGACDIVPLLAETGYACVPAPIVETSFVAVPLIEALDASDNNLLEEVGAGRSVISTDLGGSGLIPFGDMATTLLLGGDQPQIVEINAARLVEVESIDGSRSLRRLESFQIVGVSVQDPALLEAAWQRGVLGTAAQLIGLSRRLLDMTVAYVKERTQFGVPVGSFQAVKHHLSNALLAVEFAWPAVMRAAYSLDTSDDAVDREIATAKALTSDAAALVARITLQCHGAIAYTVEYDYHLFAKRIWVLSRAWGDAQTHRRRVARSLGLG